MVEVSIWFLSLPEAFPAFITGNKKVRQKLGEDINNISAQERTDIRKI
jgi:hypothetical protein